MDRTVTLFLCGDVMTGRGVDQILPHPCNPAIYEPYAASALDYLRLAEEAHGDIPAPVDFAYVWGEALSILNRVQPDARIINLETSITRSDDAEPKGINYRMSPENAPCLTAADIDCCTLANNHIFDWGVSGLQETLQTLERHKLKFAGAGRNAAKAASPAVIELSGNTRVLVYAFGSPCSGIPLDWKAREDRPGVNVIPALSSATAEQVAKDIRAAKRSGDIIVASIHWGPNWGYQIPEAQRDFAQLLIDKGGVDIVHGHSSHHAKGIEVYNERPVLYGCGDFLDDYEGISGYEQYRDDLAVMYFADLAADEGALQDLFMIPLLIRNFSLQPCERTDVEWMRDVINRESTRFGVAVELRPDGSLGLTW